ncbi:MAG: acetolactate decarboxylase [Corynebacterium sp.]|nr:acetolactate decarboxylase [Corynebacterium sp.]
MSEFNTPAKINRKLPIERHSIFQNSLMTALLDGIYDGEMTIGELLGHGNFGLGTFDALDGEMVILDGVCYQLFGDGTARIADLTQHSPYAVVTNFVPRIIGEAPRGVARKDLSPFVASLMPSENYMYALRIKGLFRKITMRTVTKQSKPYRPMMQATGDDAEVVLENVYGTLAGFRTPVYEKGISVPGCHVHFINDERTTGGHVLDFVLDEGTVELCPGTDLNLRLPLTHDFSTASLDPEDLDHQLHAVEIKD